MAVTIRNGRVYLLWNAEFVLECSAEELVGVLQHEVHHLLFEHLFHSPDQFPNRRARIIAEEVTVNEWVSEPLPGEVITLKHFPQLPPDEDTTTRYQRLVCDDAFHDASNDSEATAWQGTVDLSPLDDHSVWNEVVALGEAGRSTVRLAVQQVWEQLSDSQRSRLPNALRQHITRRWLSSDKCQTESLAAPGVGQTLNWGRVLASHVFRGLARRSTYSRPPRRFRDRVGIIPGQDTRGDRGHVVAVIDTSGSISVEMLQQIHRELIGIRRQHDVTVMECDSQVRRTYPLCGPLAQVLGRGQTDLRPPFRDDVLRRSQPDLIVYFTDGQGPAPDNPPPIPVLWCITQNGIRPADWGRVVRMTC
jgi:predicted metal-dependent peptidase